VSHPRCVYSIWTVQCIVMSSEHNCIKKWYVDYYTINYMFRPLCIGHPQVFLKFIELLYKQYGVLWGDEISFTILGGMNQNFWDGVFYICCSLLSRRALEHFLCAG
jgi:hypothetical protein